MAQTCIDMKDQYYVNSKDKQERYPSGDGWYRCKSVTFEGETAIWELSRTGHYDFLDAYRMTPHRQLVRATDDDSLRVFVKAWGPLRTVLGEWSGSDPIDAYRKARDRVTVASRILASVEEPDLQRAALQGLVTSLSADKLFPALLEGLRKGYRVPSDVGDCVDGNHLQWVESLTKNQRREVIAEIVPIFAVSAISPRYRVERSRAGNVLKASLAIQNLMEAMTWMIWQDVFQNHPMQFCVECRKLIEFKTHHAKKFCSFNCAHRRTARESARRKREEERKSNVTQKTR